MAGENSAEPAAYSNAVLRCAHMARFRISQPATTHRQNVADADYLIDRFRVRHDSNMWTCGCDEFVASNACRHTREAAGRHMAQPLITAYLQAGASRTLTFERKTSARN